MHYTVHGGCAYTDSTLCKVYAVRNIVYTYVCIYVSYMCCVGLSHNI